MSLSRDMIPSSANIPRKTMSGSANFGNGGETEHPLTLQDLALNYLCENIDEICVTKPVIITPKRRRVNSGSNHSYISEIDLNDKLHLVSNPSTYSTEANVDNLMNSSEKGIHIHKKVYINEQFGPFSTIAV